jgi:hypothetical protein
MSLAHDAGIAPVISGRHLARLTAEAFGLLGVHSISLFISTSVKNPREAGSRNAKTRVGGFRGQQSLLGIILSNRQGKSIGGFPGLFCCYFH